MRRFKYLIFGKKPDEKILIFGMNVNHSYIASMIKEYGDEVVRGGFIDFEGIEDIGGSSVTAKVDSDEQLDMAIAIAQSKKMW